MHMNILNRELTASEQTDCVKRFLASCGVSISAMERWSPVAQVAADNEVLIYGPIVSDITARFIDAFLGEGLATSGSTFRERLNSIDDDVIVRINSPGGDVWEGSSILGALTERRIKGSKISVRIDGLAASAATFALTESDEIEATQLATVMIHKVSSFVVGTANELRKTADLMDGLNATLAKLYGKKMGLDAKEIDKLLDAETFYTAEQAVEAGLVDKLVEYNPDADPAGNPANSNPMDMNSLGKFIETRNLTFQQAVGAL